MKTKKLWKEAKQIFDNFGLTMKKKERNNIQFVLLPSLFCPALTDDEPLYQFTVSFHNTFDSFVKEFYAFAKNFDSEKETADKISKENKNRKITYHEIAQWVRCYDNIKTTLLQTAFNMNEYLEEITVEDAK